MVFSSQSFTAPTLDKNPKLGKKMVSSSVFRGASKAIGKSTTIKIPKGMQIGGSKSYVDPSYLRKEENTPIEQTLVETNNILIEIQNQLATDFAYRIPKEQEDEGEKEMDLSKLEDELGSVFDADCEVPSKDEE